MVVYTPRVSAEISPVIDYTYLPTESLKPGDVIIHENEIKERINELAQEIAKEYKGKNLLIVGLLNGSFIFMADMVRALHKAGLNDLDVDFMQVSSYGSETQTSGDVKIEKDIRVSPQGRHVLIIDDIADTRRTTHGIGEHFQDKGLSSFEVLALLDKPSRKEVDVPIKYVGFKIPNVWVEGYGMDSYGHGRANPHIVKGPTFSSPSKSI